MIQITKHNAGTFEQISVSSQETDRKALLTRFKGQRTWSVRGGYMGDLRMKFTCHDGPKELFIKSTALELAHRWVEFGWDHL